MMKTKRKRAPRRPATMEGRCWQAMQLLVEVEKLGVLSPGDVELLQAIKTRLGRAWHEARTESETNRNGFRRMCSDS